jgi:hypothetical protein
MNITWENKEGVLERLDQQANVKFMLKAAKLVSHLNDDPILEVAIKMTESWIKDPSEENRKAARKISNSIFDMHENTKDTISAASKVVAYAAGIAGTIYSVNNKDDLYYDDNCVDDVMEGLIYVLRAVGKNQETVKQQLTSYLKEIYCANDIGELYRLGYTSSDGVSELYSDNEHYRNGYNASIPTRTALLTSLRLIADIHEVELYGFSINNLTILIDDLKNLKTHMEDVGISLLPSYPKYTP